MYLTALGLLILWLLCYSLLYEPQKCKEKFQIVIHFFTGAVLVQLSPSPVYPGMQVQVKLPGMLAQFAFTLQGSERHSLRSGGRKEHAICFSSWKGLKLFQLTTCIWWGLVESNTHLIFVLPLRVHGIICARNRCNSFSLSDNKEWCIQRPTCCNMD